MKNSTHFLFLFKIASVPPAYDQAWVIKLGSHFPFCPCLSITCYKFPQHLPLLPPPQPPQNEDFQTDTRESDVL